MSEKRSYDRFIIYGEVMLKPEDEPARVLKTDLIDISCGGLSVYAQEVLEVGKIVLFELTTALFETPLKGKGKIKYVKEVSRYANTYFKIGIEFIDIDRDMVARLINVNASKRHRHRGLNIHRYDMPF